MDLKKVGFHPQNKQNSKQINESASELTKKIEEQLNTIPDIVFEITYVIDGVERHFNLKSLLDIDVQELSELTLTNLRVQIEKIASIRFTIERAYEQMMEDFGLWEVNYDIWWSNILTRAREKYWIDQLKLFTDSNLAKSGMKTPTQDDLRYTALLVEGIKVEYQMKKEKQISFQRKEGLFKKIDEILQSRSYELKTIIESRMGKG